MEKGGEEENGGICRLKKSNIVWNVVCGQMMLYLFKVKDKIINKKEGERIKILSVKKITKKRRKEKRIE